MIESIQQKFEKRFGKTPRLFSSPGRVNLIGEHTDYNNGFVLPASVNKAIHFAIERNDDQKINLYASDLDQEYSTALNEIEKSDCQWANYLLGVVKQFVIDEAKISGFDCIFGGDLPSGAGMSSSAAISCGLSYALNQLFELGYDKLDLVKKSQKAEIEYAGVQCGIMDQFAIIYGKQNHVIKLDCETLDYQYINFSTEKHHLLLVNTGVKHSLASSEYNVRRKECEKGVSILQKFDNKINSLRDVSPEFISKYKNELTETIYRRCSYVIEENIRVQEACKYLMQNDLIKFGEHMYASHEGLRDKYEVSCTELDHLVNITRELPGVIGARMMGGGFGGCTINLVNTSYIKEFRETISANYKTPGGKVPQIIEVVIDNGTRTVKSPV